jgi:phosphate transport system permease protein
MNDRLDEPLSPFRSAFTVVMTAGAFIFTGLALLPLFAILGEILRQGIPQLNWSVFTALPAPIGVEDRPNGFANAIVGTLTMVGLAAIFSIPLGIMTGIFLSELARDRKIGIFIRSIAVILSSTPSIIVGVFAYGVLVLTTKQFSAIAGSFALGAIMLPIVSLTTEEALKLVPDSYRLGSAALGGGRFHTTFRLVLPAALGAIVTGALLAVARAAGETAPLMFTALFTQFWQEGLFAPTPSMTVFIYQNATSPSPEQNAIAWTASLVLLLLVSIVSIVSRIFFNKIR